MKNIRRIREVSPHSPHSSFLEDFVKNHQDIIMAYGVVKNVLENFEEVGNTLAAGKKITGNILGGGSSPKVPPKVQYPRIEEAKGPYSHWYPGIMD